MSSISPALSANLGVRYEYYGVFKEVDGRAIPFDIINCGGYCAPGSTFAYPDRNNVAPRLNLAWAPAALHDATVITLGAAALFLIMVTVAVGRIRTRMLAQTKKAELAAWQLRQCLCVDQAARRFGQRQHRHQHVGAGQEGSESVAACEGLDAIDLALRSRPALHRIAKRREPRRDGAAHLAEAQHADGGPPHIAAVFVLLPVLVTLLREIDLHVALVMDHAVDRVFGHLLRHAGVFEAHDRQMRGHRTHRQDGVDAGAVINHCLQLGLPREQLGRWLPADQVVAGLVGRPGEILPVRLMLAQLGDDAGHDVEAGGLD